MINVWEKAKLKNKKTKEPSDSPHTLLRQPVPVQIQMENSLSTLTFTSQGDKWEGERCYREQVGGMNIGLG